MKLVGKVILWRKYPCCVNDISRSKLDFFCGVSDTSDTSDTSNTANSSVASKTSLSVTRLSSYFERRRCFF